MLKVKTPPIPPIPLMKIRKNTLLSTAALAFGATFLFAPLAGAAAKDTKLNSADERFIQNEAASGVALVKLAELGAKRATRPEVKDFAAMIVEDHNKASADLKTLAASKGVELPSEASSKSDDLYKKLENTSDADFDKKFLSTVVSGHEKTIKNFTKASEDAEDSEVKAWATRMLSGLQAHLEKAESLTAMSTAKMDAETTKSSKTEPDNTARNKRDRDDKTLTPLDQGNSKEDISITAQIRKEVVALKDLSINGQNVKIITKEGHVTLRGPVNSADEKRLIGEIATRLATPEHTDNQLEVVSDSK